jgi:hypothetical protein
MPGFIAGIAFDTLASVAIIPRSIGGMEHPHDVLLG